MLLYSHTIDAPYAIEYTTEQLRILGSDGITKEGLLNAIKVGYRFIDSAMVYGSHSKIKEAIEQSGSERQAFFIATKIPGSALEMTQLAKSTEDAALKCLAELDTNYVDMMYLHGPDAFQPEVLDALSLLKKNKMIRHIGLSNVSTKELTAINKLYRISAVQVEFNPYSWDESLLEYCKEHQIDIVGYRPFRLEESEKLLADPTLKEIAAKVNSSVSGVILGWMGQKGVIPVSRANSFEHLKSNFSPLRAPLSDEDMEAIDELNQHNPSCKWEQYSRPDLLKRSQEWIDSIP